MLRNKQQVIKARSTSRNIKHSSRRTQRHNNIIKQQRRKFSTTTPSPQKKSETIAYPTRTGPATTKQRNIQLNVLQLPRVSPLLMLHIEERLLRHDPEKKNYLILNRPLPHHRSVVLGVSGKPHDLVHVENAKADGIPLIRRFTGGGTVFITSDIRFCGIVLNKADLPKHIEPYPTPVMQWTGELYNDLINNLREQSSTQFKTYNIERPTAEKDLTFLLNENDYCLNSLKFAGNAQSFIRERLVHHTSILWELDIDNISKYLTLPNKRPEYRQNRSHREFLTDLRPHFDITYHLARQTDPTQTTLGQDDYAEFMDEYNPLTTTGGCPYTHAHTIAKQNDQTPPNIFNYVSQQQQQYMSYTSLLTDSLDANHNDQFNKQMLSALDQHFDLNPIQLGDIKHIIDVEDPSLGTWLHDPKKY